MNLRGYSARLRGKNVGRVRIERTTNRLKVGHLHAVFPGKNSTSSLMTPYPLAEKRSVFSSGLRDDKAPCGALCVARVAATVQSATNERAQCISLAPPLAAVKTHVSFDSAGSSRTEDGRERTAAANLPVDEQGSERREAAYPAANSREQRTPAAKAECMASHAGRRLATDNRHSRVKQVSPQTCVSALAGGRGGGSGLGSNAECQRLTYDRLVGLST